MIVGYDDIGYLIRYIFFYIYFFKLFFDLLFFNFWLNWYSLIVWKFSLLVGVIKSLYDLVGNVVLWLMLMGRCFIYNIVSLDNCEWSFIFMCNYYYGDKIKLYILCFLN